MLAEAGLLPREMPDNYTFRKVKKILPVLEEAKPERLREAIAAARQMGVHGALAAVIFIRHHLGGAHEVEVDRVEAGEEGEGFAVLVYEEGELPLKVAHLPQEVKGGMRLRYDPVKCSYHSTSSAA
ncbi:MAG: hypothetical protein ABW208_00610 [Pyrinomonadaceae bacterium]